MLREGEIRWLTSTQTQRVSLTTLIPRRLHFAAVKSRQSITSARTSVLKLLTRFQQAWWLTKTHATASWPLSALSKSLLIKSDPSKGPFLLVTTADTFECASGAKICAPMLMYLRVHSTSVLDFHPRLHYSKAPVDYLRLNNAGLSKNNI